MLTDQHIWVTDDGRHVPDGHPDAAVLRYAAGDSVPDEVAAEAGVKAAPAPDDKEAAVPADKGGVRVDTVESLRREAADLGIEVNKHWGAHTLRSKIDKAKAGDTEGSDEEE